MEISFSVAAKVPRFHYFSQLHRQPFHIADSYPLVCPAAKLMIANSLASFL